VGVVIYPEWKMVKAKGEKRKEKKALKGRTWQRIFYSANIVDLFLGGIEKQNER
jgi:hypothetical protein